MDVVILKIPGRKDVDKTPSTDLLEYRATYYPQPATRDLLDTTAGVTLQDTDFVQFEFDDDTVWFSNSRNINELFPGSVIKERGNALDTVIIPVELGRDLIQERGGGLKKVFLKVLRIFRRKETPVEAVRDLAADFEAQVLGTEPGLFFIGDDFSLTKFTPPAADDGKPYLLFLHGALSSTVKSFGKMGDTPTWRAIKAKYGNKVLGFQHRSVIDGPLKNVLDLVTGLPNDCKLHVVSQSRGGIVGEALSRFYNSVGGIKGFTPAEIEIFRAAGQQQDIDTIGKIAGLNKKITIEKFIRAAGPGAGTTLASDRLDRWLNLVSNLVGLIAGPLYPALRHFIVAAVNGKNDPGELAGLQALRPDSAFTRAINMPNGTVIDNALVIISGRAKYFKKRALVLITSLFFREDNDFIVDTDSMYAGTPRSKLVQYMMDEGAEVNHFNYFENDSTISKFEAALLTVPFGSPIPGFVAQAITAHELVNTRAVPAAAVSRSATEQIIPDKLHYINVGPGGTFAPSGNAAFDTIPKDVDDIISAIRKNGTTNVALYFHGGLVNANNGMDTAIRVTNLIKPANKVYPIAFVWETGLFETILSSLKELHQTELFKKLLVKALKIAAGKLGLEIPDAGGTVSRGIDKLTEDAIRKELQKPIPFEGIKTNTGTRSVNSDQDLTMLEGRLRPEVQAEVNADPELVALIEGEKGPTEILSLNKEIVEKKPGETKSRGIISTARIVAALVKVIYRTVERHIKKRDHGFYPTVVEEILREVFVANTGAWIWKQMKDKAAAMWTPDSNEIAPGDTSQHAGYYLLRALNKYGDEIDKQIAIDLVGHSAGSIAVAESLAAIRSFRRLTIRKVIFMAPAITCKLFHEKVLAVDARFEFFRIFTMSDEYETKDKLASVLYPRSLLYFISGCLEDEGKESDEYVLGLQRHLSDKEPYSNVDILKDIRKFIANVSDTCVYAVTPNGTGAGLQSLSISHGGFDNDFDGTLKSMEHILNK